jgi:hypothetical protein
MQLNGTNHARIRELFEDWIYDSHMLKRESRRFVCSSWKLYTVHQLRKQFCLSKKKIKSLHQKPSFSKNYLRNSLFH